MKSEWGRSSLIIHLKLWSTCLFTFYVLFIWFLLVFFFVLRVSLSFSSLRRFASAPEVFKKINWRPIIARQVTQIPNNPLSMLIPFKAIILFQLCIVFECHRVVNLSQLFIGRRWLYFPMGYNLISMNLIYWIGSAKCYI